VVTRIFLDTEFLDDGERIHLISIGLEADTGDEYYGISADCDYDKVIADPWLRRNVMPHLPIHLHTTGWEWNRHHPDFAAVRPRSELATDVQAFVGKHHDPEIWAYFSPFDHVAMCQLYGPMNHLPKEIPPFTRDLMQEADRQETPLPQQDPKTVHHAGADAHHAAVIGRTLAW
jgi:hypothetical protein